MYYEIAKQERWFENSGANPFFSVFYGDFEFLCERMALYNAVK